MITLFIPDTINIKEMKNMKCEDINNYLGKLEHGLMNYMQMPANERSSAAVDSMVQCYMHVSEMRDTLENNFKFTPEKAEKWLVSMQNEDGSKGGHWSLEATNKFKPESLDITDWEWECAMNMMYSDYYSVAVAHGINVPEFYADLAEAFLKDKDARKNKIAAYYNCIVDG